MKSLSLIAISALLLTACGGWSHPNKSQSDYSQDNFYCQRESLNMYPVQMKTTGQYVTPATTTCNRYGNTVNRTTNPAQTTGGYQQDTNAISRNAAWGTCMRAQGWVWLTKS